MFHSGSPHAFSTSRSTAKPISPSATMSATRTTGGHRCVSPIPAGGGAIGLALKGILPLARAIVEIKASKLKPNILNPENLG